MCSSPLLWVATLSFVLSKCTNPSHELDRASSDTQHMCVDMAEGVYAYAHSTGHPGTRAIMAAMESNDPAMEIGDFLQKMDDFTPTVRRDVFCCYECG